MIAELVEHFDRQVGETCPFCDQNDRVFVGHGEVRHCTRCVLSWGAEEAAGLRLQRMVSAQEARHKRRELPASLKKRIRETTKGLHAIQAASAKERLQRLRAIPESEWQEAANNEQV